MITLTRPDFWSHRGLIAWGLWPLSQLYRLGARIRSAMVKPVPMTTPLICVGNVIAGGAGKTPVAIAIAKHLQQQGKTVCFLSKNYRGRAEGPLQVTDNHIIGEIGDEVALLRTHAPVIIAKNRKAGLIYADSQGFDAIITDDGYQNPHMKPDKRILVLDGYERAGNGFLLPAGPLRQGIEEAEEMADLTLDRPTPAITDPAPDPALTYTAFCGIGNPDKFFRFLKDSGYSIDKEISFPDHYDYQDHNLAALGPSPLITTEKDWVKLPRAWQDRVACLRIHIPSHYVETVTV